MTRRGCGHRRFSRTSLTTWRGDNSSVSACMCPLLCAHYQATKIGMHQRGGQRCVNFAPNFTETIGLTSETKRPIKVPDCLYGPSMVKEMAFAFDPERAFTKRSHQAQSRHQRSRKGVFKQ